MIRAQLHNNFHTICLTESGKWHFQGHYSDYAVAAQQAKSWNAYYPQHTYYVTEGDPLQMTFARTAPAEYIAA